jgi:hypothetical protein
MNVLFSLGRGDEVVFVNIVIEGRVSSSSISTKKVSKKKRKKKESFFPRDFLPLNFQLMESGLDQLSTIWR